VLSLVYYECPMLCSMVLDDQVRALRALPYELGKDFELVSVSIDPDEGPELAGEKKRRYVESWKRDASASERDGWHFLTGERESIDALAAAVGFRYEYDAAADEYAHAAGIMVLTPDGTLSRYLYGLGYEPRDLKLAIVDASDRKVGSFADQLLVRCMEYDPTTGKYHVAIMTSLRAAGVLTVVLLVGWIVRDLRRGARRVRREASA
jgi:protein SCO1/2